MTNFGNILKNLLEERGISQKWLAEASDTKEATISRYVTGVNKSSRIDILVNIAKALNVSTDYLLGLSETPQIKTELTTEERVLLSAFRKASERDSGLVLQVLDPYFTPSEKVFLARAKEVTSQSKAG